MQEKKRTKYIHEGRCVATVEVTLIEDDNAWAPYLSLEDAYRLDDVREALRSGDIQSAARYGQVFELHPVA